MSESSEEEETEWEVSGPWLESALRQWAGGELQVLSWRLASSPLGRDRPVLSDIVAVRVDCKLQGGRQTELALVLKLLPREPFQRYFVTQAQFDLREIGFYTKVVGETDSRVGVALPVPKLYHAHYSGACQPSVLVLEDLTSAGYEVPSFATGLTLPQAEAALRAVATVHAASLALKQDGAPLDTMYPFLFQTALATDSYQQLVERGLPQLTRFLKERPGTEELIQVLDRLKPLTKELISALLAPEEPLGCITHTDFWCENLAFSPDQPVQCKILDWQMVTYSKGTNDVALLLLSSLPTQLRRQYTQHLLQLYLDSFMTQLHQLNLQVEYSEDQMKEDFKRSQLLAVLLCIGSVDVALGDPVTEQRLVDLLTDLHHQGVLDQPDIIPPPY